ncbi:syntaxin-5-like [Amphibalanus amphitrite]|uniref:syntaxin-5-like n=1 Tax=Amphibalanus amphitrite TaxID=1232801 RepID=UPI001C92252A|nr:syntaxin-5-like [Amphibalanus amphitrite]XP_043218079.1 syntaxin-5-like [Amphibalanus amphitrite]XP_043218080.1 syntaxin-5-like [Amphibalanus amphitrite]XP_043218081.1 syntaxin-5-like [Amphibalanus amphitrite]XP_043218082.1 syntaxin-5-like [Amphibalanus amphitrite]XP_043218083.1 syntaxin-5-like [Amphibalanus amphitrite]
MPSLDVQACRDRSGEFSAVVRALRERQQAAPAPAAAAAARPAALSRHKEFMAVAKLIGRDISQTYSKLEKLTLLAKRRSLYEDRPMEIEELTHIIKQDMGSLNKQILQLQQLSRSPDGGRSVQSFSSNVVVTLQQKLANMSSQFKGVLEVRTENLRRQRSRREQFSRGGVSSNLPPSALSGFHQGSVLLADEAAARGDTVLELGAAGQQQGQMLLMEEQDTYYQARSETMKNIESTVVELGAIFQQLAHMVHEQEEMVQRIDANVEDTSMNVEAAHSEILKYFQSVSSNRWLMVKVFGVLIVFFIVFVMFLT